MNLTYIQSASSRAYLVEIFRRRRLFSLLALVMVPMGLLVGPVRGQFVYSTPYTFTTVAGRPSIGSVDGLGNAALFHNPSGVAVDQAGNVYVADTGNNTLRKIAPGGTVTTLAGLPGGGPPTDPTGNGTGSAARFDYPTGVAVDGAGNVYVADNYSDTIRKITSAGVVTTLAGTVGTPGSLDGTGSAALFNRPTGVAVDTSGNVYVADNFNHVIRKITSAGVVTTLAGLAGSSGSADGTGAAARFFFPAGLAVDANGNVYVADTTNSTIRKITPAGVVTTLAGTALADGSADGTGSAARFDNPQGVAVDSAGNVYVADTTNLGHPNLTCTIRKITPAGVVTTFAGTAGQLGFADGTGASAQFLLPHGVAVDSTGTLYVADSGNNTIRKITPAAVVTTLAGNARTTGSTDGTGSAARFAEPNGVAADGVGNVYVADFGNSTIRKITAGGVVTTLAGTASSTGSADGTGSAAQFKSPQGVAVDGAGNVYVADTLNHTIRKITAAGVVTTLAGTAGSTGSTNGTGSAARFYSPYGVAVDNAGNVYVADRNNHAIRKITPAGVVTTLAGGNFGWADGTGAAAQFDFPASLAVDGAGNVFVADTYSSDIRKITPAGVVTTFASVPFGFGATDGTGSAARFNMPAGVAADGAGNVYVADTVDNLIRKISPAGVVTTLGGLQYIAGSTDGTGSAARFNGPTGLAVDSAGNLYVADTVNNTIRKGSLQASLPVITTQPTSQMVTIGSPVIFTSAASGYPAPTYQWQRNGVNINGATGSSYAIAQVATGDAGTYRLVATNTAGSAASNAATLTVRPAVSVAADFNGDGQGDLLWQNTVSGERAIWFMNGTGAASAVSLGVTSPEWSVAALGDFNADGKPDILWQNTVSGERAIWLMNGTSILSSVSLGITSTDWTIAAAGDFNADGESDILWTNTATGERAIWLMNGTAPASSVSLGDTPFVWSIAGTGDFNNDGQTDILLQNTATGERAIWLMSGTTIASSISLGVTSTDWSIAGTTDLNADGKPDILLTNTTTGERSAWLMNGTTVGSTVSLGTVGLDWVLMRPVPKRTLADFNGDGKSDILWTNTATGDRSLWLMNGTAPASGVALGMTSVEWVIAGTGDFNGDGKADILWTNTNTGDRSLWLMAGTSPASGVALPSTDLVWAFAAIGDFNADGYSDIALTNTSTGERVIWLMNGTSVNSSVSLGVTPLAWVIAGAADFNGDGKSDLLVSNTSTGERAIWLMNGTAVSSIVSLGVTPVEWTIGGTGDFNGDGFADIIWQNSVTGDRSLWLMRGTAPIAGVALGVTPTVWLIRN